MSPAEDRILLTGVRAFGRHGVLQEERAVGIHHIDPTGAIDVGIQVIELAKLDPTQFDPRLCGEDGVCVDPRTSDAIIVNVAQSLHPPGSLALLELTYEAPFLYVRK